MSAVPAGFDALTGRVNGRMWSVEEWEADPAAQDAAYALVRASWELPHVPAAQRVLIEMASKHPDHATGGA